MMIYITGGERSGKSSFAQQLALQYDASPVYLATSRKWDSDHQNRINRHQSDRDQRWTTIEEEKQISKVLQPGATVVMDCVTLWLTNYFVDTKNDVSLSLSKAKTEINKALKINTTLIIISNEIGMGGHAPTEVGRKFTELQGWMNQYLAKRATKAYLMVSGIPVVIKESV